MHQRFLLERQWYNSLNSDTIIPQSSSSNPKRHDRATNNQLGEFLRKLDVLLCPWWVRLPEGERKPETRRAHAAAVYAVSTSNTTSTSDNKDKSTGTNPVDPGPDGPDTGPQTNEVADTENDNENGNGNGNDSTNQETISRPDARSRGVDEDTSHSTATTTSISTTTNIANSTNNNVTTPAQQSGKRVLAESQEYMIITGGFTDRDWKTFPVWAYDMTSAIADSGRWFELTPPDLSLTAEVCSNNATRVGINHSQPCSPASRVGHISVVREGDLYVFGGLEYNDSDGVFFMETEPYMYKMGLSEEKFESRDYENHEGKFDAGAPTDQTMYWKRWLPKVTTPPKNMQSSQIEDFNFTVNRGEVRGGYWENGDKLIVYGGLHVREYKTSIGREQQSDTTLGDVWAYDFKVDTWEMLASTWGLDGLTALDHPGERTSHAATIVGDELVVYGGLRKIETYLWDGSTVWSQLDDIWIFNLKSLTWKQRPMAESMGRAYHSLVGWEMPERGGTILASFGGYKMMMDPVDNQQISYVYDDTMVSMPQVHNISEPSVWYLASYNNIKPGDTISTRLEHTSVLSKEYGNMFVWGGRYRQTSEISGVWSLNIAGDTSEVEFIVRNEDAEMANAGAAYVILLTVMMMSMMFTYACGVVQRRAEGEFNADAAVVDPTAGRSVFGRNGLNQDIIDTLPQKKYQHETSGDTEQHGSREGGPNTSDEGTAEGSSSMNFNFNDDDEEHCCPICLVEYEVGDDIRCLPCNHEFHKCCVDPWLGNNASCPACRYSLSDLVSLTTSAESFAQAIRATISASLTTRPSADSASEEQHPPQNIAPPLPRHPASPPSAPDQAIAPGTRTLASLRRMIAGVREGRRRTRLQLNDSLSSRSGEDNGHMSSDDNDSFGDLELSYNSSLELTESFESRSNDSFDSGDVPIEGRQRQMFTASSDRRRRRGRGRTRRMRRVRGLASLDVPLQPSDASIV